MSSYLEQIKTHLADKQAVIAVCTRLRQTNYTSKHSGMFSEHNGSLYVQHGKGKLQLTMGEFPLVKIMFGRKVTK